MVLKKGLKLGEVSLIECGTPSRNTCNSVSWNSTGTHLASASTDRIVRLWNLDQLKNNAANVGANNNTTTPSATAQEVLALSGHAAPVELVRFHPQEPSLLCSAAADASIRFWDIRWVKQRGSMGRIELKSKVATSVEWCPASDRPYTLVVTEGGSHIHLYDTRKLTSTPAATATATSNTTSGGGGGASTSTTATLSPLRSLHVQPNFVESARFSPLGNHLMAAVTVRTYGMGEVHVLPCTVPNDENSPTSSSSFTYPAHTGSIFAHTFSPDGRRYATGGSDAMVGLWHVPTMTCTHTITRRAKFIRSLSFSHDSKLLASSSEDDGIDLADAATGDMIGMIPLGGRGGGGGAMGLMGTRGVGGMSGGGGADEISFHPKIYLLACARGNFNLGGAPVVIAKFAVTE